MTDLNDDLFSVTEPQHDAVASSEAARARAPLGGTDPLIVLAYETLRRDFATWLAHAPRPGALPGPEAVHQMRIATRRIRVALKLFAKLLPVDARAELNRELRRFARALGGVRDLDVYAENFASYLRAAKLPQDALTGYGLALEEARRDARDALSAVFAGEHYRVSVAAMRDLIAGPPPAALRRWRSFRIDEGASLYLQAARRRITKRGRAVDRWSPPEQLHGFRIAAKRFRYELDVFAGIYPELRAPAKAAKRLQDVLGRFQDAITAIERLESWRARFGPHTAPVDDAALAQLLHGQRSRAAAALDELDDEWRRFEKTVTRRALAKALGDGQGEPAKRARE